MTVTNLTGLAPLPEAESLPIGQRVLIDDVQQLCRLGQVAVYLGLQGAGNPFYDDVEATCVVCGQLCADALAGG